MKSQTLFALNGEARGAARLMHDGESGTLAVEIAARATEDCEAWLVPRCGALLRAPLGPAMRAAVPAQAKGAAGIFIASGGKIISSGGNGLTKADMESAALRVQLALASARKEAPVPAAHEPPAPKKDLRSLEPAWEDPAPLREQRAPEPAGEPDARAAFAQTQTHASPIPANGASRSCPPPAQRPDEQSAERLLREAGTGPAVRSEAARSIVSLANSLFHPPAQEEHEFAYVQAPAVTQAQRTPGAQGMRQSLSNAQPPMQSAPQHGAQQPFNRQRRRSPRRCPGRR